MSDFILRPKIIRTQIVDYALRRDRIVKSAAGVHDTSRFLSVMVEDTSGARGYGEAALTALWSGETAQTAQWVIENLFAPVLLKRDFNHPREALAVMDATIYGSPFTKSAVDTALWDIWTKLQAVSVTELIADREPVQSIPTRASVGAYSVDDTVRIATTFWESGIKTLKFKIGVDGLDDGARLRAVRENLGDEPIFTVDANGAYHDARSALDAIESLLPYRLSVVEQPTTRDRLALLAQVKSGTPVPVMADESVSTPDQLEEALDLDAFDILSIYPGKNGGFTHALDMARRAHNAGKKCVIGCNLETDAGQAAMAQLAAGLAAFPVEELAGDLPAAIFYEATSVKEPLPLCDGRIRVPQGPGFGITPLCWVGD